MDDHHRKLFDILNVLLDAMKVGTGETVLAEQLSELNSYAQYHFSEEEKLMLEVGYPGVMPQQQAHKAFLEKVAAYKAEVEAGHGAFIISEVVTTVTDWLKRHILEMDMQYESYVREKLKMSA